VAAKTGTAEVGSQAQYTSDWMVAFAPADHPQVVVAVVAPFQPASLTGAQTSGPPACAILESALSQPQACPGG
jgi:peptidoglycan glycosyltransferase